MIRMIPVPDDIPDGFEAIILVFAQTNSDGNTAACAKASESILAALRGKPMAQRMRVIKQLLSNIEQMLLEYSSKIPGTDVTVTNRKVC
jgi:hypothetical protein